MKQIVKIQEAEVIKMEKQVDPNDHLPTKDLKSIFWKVVKSMKRPQDLNNVEIEALIMRVGFLSDDERQYYQSVLIQSNMSTEQIDRYGKLKSLNRYFPK